jgi:protein MpaA
MIKSNPMEKYSSDKLFNGRVSRWLILWILIDVSLIIGAIGYVLLSQENFKSQDFPALLVMPTQSLPGITQLTDNDSVIWQHTQTATLEPIFTPIQTDFSPTDTVQPSATATNRILIGYSVAGRPLEVVQFGNGPVQRMIVAGIHGGNEYNTILLAKKLIRYLGERPKKIPKDVTLFILPALNPDGEARAHNIYGRANENGVDLNHNFPMSWQADWPRDGCWHYLKLTGGSRPASEPESIALMGFLLSHQVDAMISYHSAALGIFPGGDPPDPASQRLAEAVAAVSSYPYPPINTGCEMTGSLADWAASQGIAALDVELTNHTDIDFQQNLNILTVLLNWQK